MIIIDIDEYRNNRNPYITEEEVWDTIVNLENNEMLIITNDKGELRFTKVRASRFLVDVEKL
jgi:hypothetical protein